MIGMRRALPVCTRVSASQSSSSVPKPPGMQTSAMLERMKASLRLKKYLKEIPMS
jgi:hypothetical protein